MRSYRYAIALEVRLNQDVIPDICIGTHSQDQALFVRIAPVCNVLNGKSHHDSFTFFA